ncbi:MAG: type I-MYXAN CRISPR-associated protein Cas6/Cmx6, partial [Quisquiliibacterium sp.]
GLALWRALVGAVSWLADEPAVGLHPIRGANTERGLLLSGRSRLTLRMPERCMAQAGDLQGRWLAVDGERLQLGGSTMRSLEAFPTLSAAFVSTGASDELSHQQAVQQMLEGLGVPQRFICGRMRWLEDAAGRSAGGGVVLHQLRPEHSLLVQRCGIGPNRNLGWGLFLPHKTIHSID